MPIEFSREDIKTPEGLERVLQQFNRAIERPQPKLTLPSPKQLARDLAPFLRDLLQAPGAFPLNLELLLPVITSSGNIQCTHTERTTLFTPPSSAGLFLWETDRTALYTSITSGGSLVWRFVGGTYYAALASRPSDLGTNDANFRFVDSTTDQQGEWIWSGTEWLTIDYLQEVTDAVTAAVTTAQILRHLSSGNPAAGFGVARLGQLENASNATVTAFREVIEWVTATGGAEDAKWTLQLIVASALTTLLTVFPSGNVQMLATGLFQIGGATSSFPAIARGATTTNTRSRLADGSADTDHEVADEAYDPTNWNGSVEVPTKNAVRDKIETITGGETGALVSDAAFGAGWNGVTGIAPSKNAVYDELVLKVNGTGVNFGPGAVTSITVVNGVITAIS